MTNDRHMNFACEGDTIGEIHWGFFFEDDVSWNATLDLIRLIYTTTTPSHDRGLQDMVLDHFWDCIHSEDRDKVMEVDGLRDLMLEVPGLSFDLATAPLTAMKTACCRCGWRGATTQAWHCGHSRVDKCMDADCKLRFEQNSFCWKCYR